MLDSSIVKRSGVTKSNEVTAIYCFIFIFFIINKRIMDLFIIIIIIVFVLIIKYLIDTINSLNSEIKEIKDKCILNKNVTFNKKTEIPTVKINDIIGGISYFKNYIDKS